MRNAIVLSLGLLLASCGDASETGSTVPEPTEPATTRPPFETMPPLDTTPTGPPTEVSERRWQAIVDDLATRAVAGEPVLVSATAQTWNDGSLGCPSPGGVYTQALVDGVQLIVDVDGVQYDYRFGNGPKPILCQNGRAAG